MCVGLLFYYFLTWYLYYPLSAAVLLGGECLLRKHTTLIRAGSREAQAESAASSQPSAQQCWWQSPFPTERAAVGLTTDMCRIVPLWKCFKGLSPYITIMQSKDWVLIIWTTQTSAEGEILWKLCSYTLQRLDTARIQHLEAVGKMWWILSENLGAPFLYKFTPTFIIKTCSWW